MSPKPQKVPLYSLPDLKAAVDEAIPSHLTTLPGPYRFTQSHFSTNVRLALGYSAVLIAGALFALDYRYGWDVTKPYTLPACVAYFALNGALTVWIFAVERHLLFDGTADGGKKRLVLRSHTEKPRPEYVLTVEYTDAGARGQETAVSVPFARLFNVHGYLQRKELHKWLAREVAVVGTADPASKAAAMEWEREQGVVAQGALEGAESVPAGDVIEVLATPESQGLSTARNTRGQSRTPEPSSASPTKRGPGRPKKNKA